MFDLAKLCDTAADAESLTGRERDVLKGIIARGKSERALAACLGISRHTVRTHVRSVYLKLKIRNRTQLMRHILSFLSV